MGGDVSGRGLSRTKTKSLTPTMRMINKYMLAGSMLLVSGIGAFAQATPTDYGEVLTENLTKINTIWGVVAAIMIGVALVTVGVRFFRKAK